ncbi:MAG: sigma-54 dependent transcriptional regulator [Polyangiaceae bacterium]
MNSRRFDSSPLESSGTLGAAHGLIGRSPSMQRLRERLEKVAPTDAPVLIQGETGTGKEVVARAIHSMSSRADRPFVIVDCGGLPPTLLESELFGHTRGSFTGAHEQRMGAIETANTGTVFLDEIGELPLDLQPKLLRVLEQRTIRRLGDSIHRSVDVRFVSATHRDLRAMVAAGQFREDLYFRVAVLTVTVPPLRERREDISLLAAHFRGPSSAPLDESTLTHLSQRSWRGNVRELRNVVERVSALGAEAAHSIPPPAPSDGTPIPGSPRVPSFSGALEVGGAKSEFPESGYATDLRTFRETWMDHGERAYLVRLLARSASDVTAAAKAAGVDKTYIYRLLRKHRSHDRLLSGR